MLRAKYRTTFFAWIRQTYLRRNPGALSARTTSEANGLASVAGQLNNKNTGSIPFDVSLANLFLDDLINQSVRKTSKLRYGSFIRKVQAGHR